MAVISEYEEQQQKESHASTPSDAKTAEAVKPPESERPVLSHPEEQPRPPPPSPSPSPSPPVSDVQFYQHDSVLRGLLDEHKLLPLELLTTVIDFLFRETDLSRELKVEQRVTEIVTAAKRRRSAYDGEDVAPEKLAKVEESNKSPKKEAKSPKTTEPLTPATTMRGAETAESPDVTPGQDKEPPALEDPGLDQALDDAEGTGLQPNIGNGYDHEKYSWTQTLGEATLHIYLPEGTKAKAVACEIKRTTLKAGLKGQEPILEGEFFHPVKCDDCFWSLDEDGTLSVYLTKFNRMEWWNSALKGEPEINSRKVEPEKSRLDDLDSETRQTAEKMMFDQRQKALGLPTSDDSAKNEAIKKFMAQHPEMDFSKATIR